MGLFSKVKKLLEEKAVVAGVGYQSPQSYGGWFKNWLSERYPSAWQKNDEVPYEDVLMQPIQYACVNLICSDLAKLRPRVVKKNSNGVWSEFWDKVISPILLKPNHYQTWNQFLELYFNSKLFAGNTYVIIERDRLRNPIAFYILDPNRVTPLVSSTTGEVFYQLDLDPINRITRENAEVENGLGLMAIPDQIIVPASEIIHDRWNCFYHPLCGVGPLKAASLPASQAIKIQQHSRRFFANSAMMGGILTAPGHIEDETAQRAKEYFEQNFMGANAGRIAVLGDGLKYEKMSMSSADSQLIEQMRYTTEQICAIYHIPQYMITGTGPTYSNIEIMNQQYYSQCLQILIESYEEVMDNALGFRSDRQKEPNAGVELDLSSLLRMDTTTRYNNWQKGITSSFLTINEARAREDLDPVEGGDTIWMQQQNYSLEALMERDANSPLVVSQTPEPTAPVEQPTEDEEEPENIEEEQDDTERFIFALQKEFYDGMVKK